jgi:SWI/SNF-related matrix-associated actin-dependent regulator of chromatin subfamily A-like protein 1
MEAFRDEWPALIVTPSTLRDTWADATHQWLGCVDSQVHVVWKEGDMLEAQRQRKQVVIVSYDLMPKPACKTVCVVEKWFKVVVCDESHYIKNAKASLPAGLLALLPHEQS